MCHDTRASITTQRTTATKKKELVKKVKSHECLLLQFIKSPAARVVTVRQLHIQLKIIPFP